MCGIAGIYNIKKNQIRNINQKLDVMSKLIEHRGPDGKGTWVNDFKNLGLAHRRLSIIDLSESASQPMIGNDRNVITYNGEIYNYKEIRDSLKTTWKFRSQSDTECILAAYSKYGIECVNHLRGMFAFTIWDQKSNSLFCSRDRFGIKPLYYCMLGETFYFASEAKALIPFLNEIRTNKTALAEYFTFQYSIGEKTLFSGIKQLLPGHSILVTEDGIKTWRYWDVSYNVEWDHTENYFHAKLEELLYDSVKYHLRSDVEVGSYVSGGIDSSLMLNLASKEKGKKIKGFHGRFTEYLGYDESKYAIAASDLADGELHVLDITSDDFLKNINKVIYHLDFPVAGPGSFPQFMVSQLASKYLKVVLGGQGGDEIFGGYARYVIAYLEQCLNAAIEGTYKNGNFIVTLESIVPNLDLLKEYKPLIKEFWRKGLFENMDKRYFRLADRSVDITDEVNWNEINTNKVFEDFKLIFNNEANVSKEAYFDKMTHFDFKCLLPALLQVEDRMSMANGLESRVPLLDHKIVEFAASVPADIKFKDGKMKFLLKKVFNNEIPKEILSRRDKMGFPVPLKEWFNSSLKEFANDNFQNMSMKKRPYLNSDAVIKNMGKEAKFSRKTWGLLSLELWYQEFHDKFSFYKNLVK